MHEERGQLTGDQVIMDPVDLWGNIVGNAKVESGGKMYVRGNIYGNLIVNEGGRVHVYGTVTGTVVVNEGAKVILSGIVSNAVNNGGRLYVDMNARILGKLRTRSGETTVDPKAQIKDA